MARCSSNVNIYLYVTVDIIIIEKALTKIQLIQGVCCSNSCRLCNIPHVIMAKPVVGRIFFITKVLYANPVCL